MEDWQLDPEAWQLKGLRMAMAARDGDSLAAAIGTLHLCSDAVPMLSELLLADWHQAHEDIAFELGLTGDPRTIEALSMAARMQFAYLIEWGNLQAFQRKCAYALARIGTLESRQVLEGLAREEDPHLREYGEEGLGHWPLPYRT